jgi:uncharacterized phage-associated protein
MAGVRDVAAYTLRECGPMTAMKLQKLCYYAYGYHLAWEGRQLFSEHFQAWANGPVSPDLYREHRGKFMLENGDIAGDPSALGTGERESVDLVLGSYCGLTAHQLSVMTHGEAPWVKARRRSKAGPLERSTAQLRDEDILEFFDALTSATADAAEG